MAADVSDVDVVVIGMGPGGEDVAGRLAEAGLDVVGIESNLVGGECPYWGCIPSKMMIRAANLIAETRRVPGLAGQSEVTPDWTPVANRIREQATDDWNDQVAVDRFVGKGGTFVRGRGRLESADTVSVGERRYRARRGVVVATGTVPAIPPIEGLADTPYWTNHDAVEAKDLPESIVVLGGGAIGVELAQVLGRFGVETTVVEALDRLVPGEEPDAGRILADVFESEGIRVVTGTAASGIAHDGRFRVTLDGGEGLDAERLLVATGRRVDLDAINAAAIGIPDDARSLPVDDRLRVADGVWAVGDIAGEGAFTHVAMYHSAIVAAEILGEEHHPADYAALPRVTFTDPEIGSVGLTEQAARDAGIDVAIGRQQTSHTARGWLHAAGNEGFIQLVADRGRGVLVGATAMGPTGGEVLGLLTLAVHAEVPLDQLRSMIYAYPTFHRGVEDALRDIE